VQEAQASYDSATAGVIDAKRTLAVARESLREITGEYYPELADAGTDTPLVAPEPQDVDEWVRTAISRNLKVMDATAFALCRDQKLPIRVFSIFKEGALRRAVLGEDEGTLVHV
jgi:hypothetical protein